MSIADISGLGLTIRFIASFTFPVGFDITQLADDIDPFDLPSTKFADTAMGANSNLLTWKKSNQYALTLGVVPGSDDDTNLSIVADANRPEYGKFIVNDIITILGVYNNGSTITLSNGVMTDAMPGNAMASSQRLKSKPYVFAFANVIRTYA